MGRSRRRGPVRNSHFSSVSNRKCGARAAVSRSASPALPISPALASFRRGAGPECAVFADRGFGASQVTLRKTGTARNRTNHMFNGESINASERGARSSRNGHLASCPSNTEPSHRNSVRAPPSSRFHIRVKEGEEGSLPIRLQATVVLPTINHRKYGMALTPPCMANSLVSQACMAVKD